MNKYLLPIAILLLSVSIVFLGIRLDTSKTEANTEKVAKSENIEMMDKGLLTVEETADYLSMPVEDLQLILVQQEKERKRLGSFSTYRFIPYITVNGKKYFNKGQVNEWIKYSSTIWQEIN